MADRPMIAVLIVEPNPDAAKHIQTLLMFEPDFKLVGVVDTGAAALDAAATLKPDVMMIEVTLADSEGFGWVSQVVKQFPTIAVVMMSAQPDTNTLNRAMLAGARDFLEKPLDIDKLYSTLRRVYDAFSPIRDSFYQSSSKPALPSIPPPPKPISRVTTPLDDADDRLSSSLDEVDDDEFSFGESETASPEPDFSATPPPPPAPIVMPSPIPRPPKPITPITPPAVVELPEPIPAPIPMPAPITLPTLEQTPDSDGAKAGESPESPVLTDHEKSEKKEDQPSRIKSTFFSAYYPREAQADQKNGLYVYAHLEDALAAIQKDVEKFKEELGGSVPQPRTAKQSAQIAENTPITIIPESEDIQFEPESLTKRWREPFTRFDFDFYPSKQLVDESAVVRVSVQVGGIEIASIKCGIDVVEAKATPISQPVADENPLASARFTHQQAETYRKIFISYSRKDTSVARAYQMAQLAMGNEVFLDVDSLRAGENWQAALARAIDSADIFQMFWSSSYAESDYCRYEWDYALRYRCPDQKCEGFIRPVYWVNPMPVMPPTELGHLNFKYVPFDPAP